MPRLLAWAAPARGLWGEGGGVSKHSNDPSQGGFAPAGDYGRWSPGMQMTPGAG